MTDVRGPNQATVDLDDTTPSNPFLAFLYREANFFRIHLFVFTFIPLISSGIFYGANGEFPVAYIDALFLTYSSMTVTGLSTVNLSTTTPFQQFILFALMLLGDVTMVALVMVLVRKWYFRAKCEKIVAKQRPPLHRAFTQYFSRSHVDVEVRGRPRRGTLIRQFSNFVSSPFGGRPFHEDVDAAVERGQDSEKSVGNTTSDPKIQVIRPTPKATLGGVDPDAQAQVDGDGGETLFPAVTSSPQSMNMGLPDITPTPSRAVAYATTSATLQARQEFRREATMRSRTGATRQFTHIPMNGPVKSKDIGLGGPPGPFAVLGMIAKRVTPTKVQRRVVRTFTAPPPTTLVPTATVEDVPSRRVKGARWLPGGSLFVLRNSEFVTDDLSDEQLEQLGGIEYKALRVLGYLVAAYFFFTQFFTFIVFAPYMSTRYGDVFDAQPRLVSRWWFSAFQTVAGYTGGGLSLVDEGMVPFQRTYLMIIALMFVILAGNHALPIFLRLTIWLWTKMIEDESDLDKTLHFLLDHPRRCFFYLFPSHQTWYLTIVLVLFSCIEWWAFMVLNIGLSVTEDLPVGTRLVDGLFQGLAARASGFSIVSISALAPAVQFLYVVMMYIAIFPVAMSIRSTNVYEERSLGVFSPAPDDEDEEPDLSSATIPRGERLGRYLKWHLHRQVANDIWWLVWGIFLVAIIERKRIDDPDTPWFDLFRICFELVSAFGGIGLSLGTPRNNYSFSGECGPLSKLVIIVIMLRGRHRGLPVAVDRSIMLPEEYAARANEQNANANATTTAAATPNGNANGAENGNAAGASKGAAGMV